MKGTYLAAQFRRIAARRGKGRAVIAVGHYVLVASYQMLTRKEPYHELGAQYFDEHERDHVQRRLVHRLELESNLRGGEEQNGARTFFPISGELRAHFGSV